jgi:lipid II:glycine glycyltransferase (peptidoglycan interpeptide bridge formation enzyme)
MLANLRPPFGAFLQSAAWEAMERSLGKEVVRLSAQSTDGQLQALAIKERLPLIGEVWYLPKGPVFSGSTAWVTKELRRQARGVGMIVCEPMVPLPGARPSKMWQPSHTMVVDLVKSPPERAAAMKPKTRYNIRLATKKGVTTRLGTSPEDFQRFFALLQETAARDNFHLHPEARYRAQAAMNTDAIAHIALAEAHGETLAAGLWVDYAGVRTYLHGASSSANRELMAPYAMHNFMMTDAAERGLAAYDFWGIAPTNDPSHPLAGVTRFKEGFGGDRLAMPGTFEVPISSARYALFSLLRRIKRTV